MLIEVVQWLPLLRFGASTCAPPIVAGAITRAHFVDHYQLRGYNDALGNATPADVYYSPLGFNVGRLTRHAEDWNSIFNCSGICARAYVNRFYQVDILAELYSAATGIELSPQELTLAAERTWNMYKVLNVREGFTRKDDVIPERWFEPMKTAEGGESPLTDYYKTKILSKEELNGVLDDYYDERGWDIERGLPTKQKLAELGLDDVVEDFSKLGLL